jgi:hypothetical protein
MFLQNGQGSRHLKNHSVTFVADPTHIWPNLQKYGQQSILSKKKFFFTALINFYFEDVKSKKYSNKTVHIDLVLCDISPL